MHIYAFMYAIQRSVREHLYICMLQFSRCLQNMQKGTPHPFSFVVVFFGGAITGKLEQEFQGILIMEKENFTYVYQGSLEEGRPSPEGPG